MGLTSQASRRVKTECGVTNAGSRRQQQIDGLTSAFVCNTESLRHGRGVVRLCNGDTVVQEWLAGGLVGIVEFMCSPSCLVPEFTGRRLGAGMRWTISELAVGEGWTDYVCWIDDCKDKDLFWRYVTEGLVAWTKEVRAHALRSKSNTNCANRCALI